MKKIFFVMAVASIVLVSCIKEGPPGPVGPQGRAGRDGQNGQNGRDGYGTKINTHYIDVFPNEWKKTGNYGTQGYYCFAEIDVPELILSVIDGGAVLVYMITKEGGQEYDNQLPYLLPFDVGASFTFTRIIRYDLQPNKIGFIVEDSDFKTPLPPFGSGVVKFKVVIISKT
jgi:hypothetical protein